MNDLIKELIKRCEEQNKLLYDSNLINELRKMTNKDIVNSLES